MYILSARSCSLYTDSTNTSTTQWAAAILSPGRSSAQMPLPSTSSSMSAAGLPSVNIPITKPPKSVLMLTDLKWLEVERVSDWSPPVLLRRMVARCTLPVDDSSPFRKQPRRPPHPRAQAALFLYRQTWAPKRESLVSLLKSLRIWEQHELKRGCRAQGCDWI